MTTDTEITDKNLIRCTYKKSASVLKKWVIGVSYAILAVTLLVIVAFGAMNILPPLVEIAVTIASATVTVLVNIPWYYYAIVVGISGIPAYSFLWCVARDLTEEDWKSKSANNFAFAVAFAYAVVVAFAFAFAFAYAVVVDPVDRITVWYYIFRFPGAAWNHYVVKKE